MGRPSRAELRLDISLGVPIKLLFLEAEADEGMDGGKLVDMRRSYSSNRFAARDLSVLTASRTAFVLASIGIDLVRTGPCVCECEGCG